MEKYTKIPNELLEGLAKIRLSNYELRVLWIIIRKTYGWNKPSDRIALSQFVKETGILKQHICRAIKNLNSRKVITKRGNNRNPIIAINTNWGEWKSLPKKVIITNRGEIITNSGGIITNSGTYKEHYPKNTKQRKGVFSSNKLKELLVSYKKGDKRLKPFYKGNMMRYFPDTDELKVYKDNTWKEYAGTFEEIDWQSK